VVHDQKTGQEYTPLQALGEDCGHFSITNSSLSEAAVLGFEFGYALECPTTLVIWEAQFGDFANGAQVIIDQFVSSAEQKWLRQNGLVMLLPHGYEGQGPEHSSARLERYLQLCDEQPDVLPNENSRSLVIQTTNMQVANCTTPANYFHLLRRQMHRDFRKPLVVMSPKSLLRHKQAVSPLSEFSDDIHFKPFLPEAQQDQLDDPSKIRRVLLCSGKVYYDLLRHREDSHNRDVVIGRVEQICPFPFFDVRAMVDKYPNAEVVWVQEEAMNSGAWSYVEPRIETALKHRSIRARYVGRRPSASPATGNSMLHDMELKEFLTAAFE
jgi:2-oxoglutarate dehydrogenase E1 component